MKYYAVISNNIVDDCIALDNDTSVNLKEGEVIQEINQETYNLIGSKQATFELNNGELVVVQLMERSPEPPSEPSQDDYLLDLDFRLSTIELGLGGI